MFPPVFFQENFPLFSAIHFQTIVGELQDEEPTT